MRVIITIQSEYSAITITDDAVTIYRRYIGQDAEITLEEYSETLERDGKIVLENEKTGRKVTIKRIGESKQ